MCDISDLVIEVYVYTCLHNDCLGIPHSAIHRCVLHGSMPHKQHGINVTVEVNQYLHFVYYIVYLDLVGHDFFGGFRYMLLEI